MEEGDVAITQTVQRQLETSQLSAQLMEEGSAACMQWRALPQEPLLRGRGVNNTINGECICALMVK
eukprot:9492288-Pyramimonas_sp.AAC.1